LKRRLFARLLMIGLLFVPMTAQASDFNDVSKHWAKDKISQLSSAGLIAGYPDGSFKPDYPMTKAEFTALLVSSMGLAPTDKTSKTFSDTGSHWARAFINEAVKKGLLVPAEYPEGLKPDTSIKRSEVCAMLVRALSKSPEKGSTKFTDQTTINQSLYKGYIKTAVDDGLLAGYPDGSFNPFGNMKRGEICSVVTGFLAKYHSTSTSTAGSKTTSNSSPISLVLINNDAYDISQVQVSFKSGAVEIPVNQLASSGDVLQVNAQYTFPLNTGSGNPDFIVGHKRFGINNMQLTEGKLLLTPKAVKINTLAFNNQILASDVIKLYLNSVYSNCNLGQMEIIDENHIILNGQTHELTGNNVSIALENQLYSITKISLLHDDTIPQLKATGIIPTAAESSGGEFEQPDRVAFYNQSELCYFGLTSFIQLQAGGNWTAFNTLNITSASSFKIDDANYNFIGCSVKINQSLFVITDTAWNSKNKQLDIIMKKI
jgi:hypothetical protein